MPMLAYTAPSTVEEAVRALAGASGVAKVLSGGTDLLVQLRSGRTRPALIVDTKKIPGISGIRERERRLRHRRRNVRRSDRRVRSTQARLARSGRGHQPDRLDPGPGPGFARRQSLQRIASRRQRSGADRRARDLRGRRQQRTSARFRSRASSPGRAAPRSRATSSSSSFTCRSARRARRTLICASSRAPRWTSRWSAPAVNVTLDASGVCTDARIVLGAVAPTAVLVADAATALIGRKLDDTALAELDEAARAACKPITTSAGRSNIASRSPA